MSQPATLDECFRQYINRADLKSSHTLSAYMRSIELFFTFLADRSQELAVHRHTFATPQELSPTVFSESDTPLLLQFAEWLMSPGSGNDRRPYALATVELRVAGVQHWLQFMEQHEWLSPEFPVAKVSGLVRDRLKTQHRDDEKAVSPIEDLAAVVGYYDTQKPPKSMLKPGASHRLERWELTRLRNRALLHCLAETGGRISELLSLDVGAFSRHNMSARSVINVDVIGKSGHRYQLNLKSALPAIRDYVQRRDITPTDVEYPLFISHDPRYDGSRMSRIVAWRVVRRAARAVGLPDVSPQDFRHWRALQLIQSGHSLEDIQALLGHRSIETVRALYAHLVQEDDTPEM